MKTKIHENEKRQWVQYCHGHPSTQFAKICLENVNPHRFWSIGSHYPDLVNRLHAQTRLMCNFELSGGVPWLFGTNRASCGCCKNKVENITHFFFMCPSFPVDFDLLLSNLETKILKHSATDRTHIANYTNNLDRLHKCPAATRMTSSSL